MAILLPARSQTLLSSHKLVLCKPFEKQHLVAAADPSGRHFFAFASDKEKTTALKYNTALFARDSIVVPRPGTDFEFIAGTSFDSSGMPFLYWASRDFSKLMSVGFDFGRHTFVEKTYSYSYEKETFLNAFDENGTFYLLTVLDEEQKLKLYIFNEGVPDVRTLDFSAFSFKTRAGKDYKLSDLLADFRVEKMETTALNPLFSVVPKSKLYIDGKTLWLTLDHLPTLTQAFRISLVDFRINEFQIQQPELQGSHSSNSFYRKGKLYQVRADDRELAISSKLIETPDAAKLYRFTENDTVRQKNSPLLAQTADQQPFEIKTTKRFLRRLSGCELGISVYESPAGLLVTTGGMRKVTNTGGIILGAALGVGIAVSGSGSVGIADELFDAQSSQQVFFESLFDEEFEHLQKEQEPLAVDFLSQFLSRNQNISAYFLTPFGGYFVLAYYDPKARAVLLRKFSDGTQF